MRPIPYPWPGVLNNISSDSDSRCGDSWLNEAMAIIGLAGREACAENVLAASTWLGLPIAQKTHVGKGKEMVQPQGDRDMNRDSESASIPERLACRDYHEVSMVIIGPYPPGGISVQGHEGLHAIKTMVCCGREGQEPSELQLDPVRRRRYRCIASQGMYSLGLCLGVESWLKWERRARVG